MAEADWGGLTAPLRRAAQALGAANASLQRLGNDRGFRARLRALSELPACITFHPFADTQQWSVDLEQDQQTSAEQAAERQAWSPRLTRQARRRAQIALVTPATASAGSRATAARAAPSASAASTPVAARGAASTPAASTAGAQRDETAAVQPATGAADVPPTGAWSALVQITQLLAELEPATAQRTSSSAATSVALTSRSARTAALSAPVPADRGAKHPGASASSVRPSRSSDAFFTRTATQQPTALLEQYVDMLWADAASETPAGPVRAAAGASTEQATAAGPAPRAPSLLLPPRAQGEAQTGAALPLKAADAALPPLVWPANDERGEESVEERLNRALLEQAWLRGVDLT